MASAIKFAWIAYYCVSSLQAPPPQKRNEELETALRSALAARDPTLSLLVEKPQTKALARVIALKKDLKLQVTLKNRGTCDVIKNYAFTEAAEALEPLFQNANRIKLNVDGLSYDMVGRKIKRKARTDDPSLDHDRTKKRALKEDDAQFLDILGLRANKAKLAQVRRFVELLDTAVPRDTRNLSLVDFGTGRGILAFAADHLFNSQRRQNVTVIGVERRQHLVDEANDLAREYPNLRFVQGDIADFQLPSNNVIVVALHACDTATDDALYQAISANATIVASPCCHKELRPQLNNRIKDLRRRRSSGELLAPGESALLDLGSHGIVLHKTTEIVTDTLRSLLLELRGYHSPRMVEWIGDDHTPRNTMLIAEKRHDRTDVDDVRLRLRDLAAYYGITTQHLAASLGEDLRSSPSSDDDLPDLDRRPKKSIRVPHRMPK